MEKSQKIRLGIDIRSALHQPAGIGHYVRGLLQGLNNLPPEDRDRFELVLFSDVNFELPDFLLKHQRMICPFQHLFHPWSWYQVMVQCVVDIYLSPASLFLPATTFGRAVPIIHDLSVFHYPKMHTFKTRFLVRLLMPLAVIASRKIIAVSESTKRDLVKRFAPNPNKIKVIYEGKPARNALRSTAGGSKVTCPQPFILYLGTLEPRKNVEGLIKAFQIVVSKLDLADYKLVVAGKKGWKYQGIFDLVKKLNLTERAVFTGYVSDEEKIWFYQNAKAFVFPSFYEGFGLPPLEAMSFGCPVVLSQTSSLPEVGGEAAIYVDARNPGSIAQGILKILRMEEKEYRDLQNRCQIQAKKFSWEKCVREILEILLNPKGLGD